MTTTVPAEASERSTPPPDGDSGAGRGMARLLRPHLWGFAAVVVEQQIRTAQRPYGDQSESEVK